MFKSGETEYYCPHWTTSTNSYLDPFLLFFFLNTGRKGGKKPTSTANTQMTHIQIDVNLSEEFLPNGDCGNEQSEQFVVEYITQSKPKWTWRETCDSSIWRQVVTMFRQNENSSGKQSQFLQRNVFKVATARTRCSSLLQQKLISNLLRTKSKWHLMEEWKVPWFFHPLFNH